MAQMSTDALQETFDSHAMPALYIQVVITKLLEGATTHRQV